MSGRDWFRAAVFEYAAPWKAYPHLSRSATIPLSLDIYAKVARRAKDEGADIIVFPEGGIYNPDKDRNEVMKHFERIPAPPVTPCNDPEAFQKHSPILYRLSCIAKETGLYLAANVGDVQPCDSHEDAKCPKDGRYQFNTNVIIDSSGTFQAKYHKIHPFAPEYPAIDAPPNPEKERAIVVDSPFGRLGTCICFDILFKDSKTMVEQMKPDTVLYPTLWFSELPLLTAVPVQNGWSMMNEVNLLAANVQDPASGSTGSGIYHPHVGPLISCTKNDGLSRLLIATLPISPRISTCWPSSEAKEIVFARDELPSLEPEPIGWWNASPKDIHFTRLIADQTSYSCNYNGVSCDLEFQMAEGHSVEGYFLGLTARVHPGPSSFWEEMCFIAKYTDADCHEYATETETVFSWLRLDASFSQGASVFPQILGPKAHILPMNQWNFTQNGGRYRISLHAGNTVPILIAGLYGRRFDLD